MTVSMNEGINVIAKHLQCNKRITPLFTENVKISNKNNSTITLESGDNSSNISFDGRILKLNAGNTSSGITIGNNKTRIDGKTIDESVSEFLKTHQQKLPNKISTGMITAVDVSAGKFSSGNSEMDTTILNTSVTLPNGITIDKNTRNFLQSPFEHECIFNGDVKHYLYHFVMVTGEMSADNTPIVVPATTVDRKIIGILDSSNKFISHGVCRIKFDNTSSIPNIGDILCPTPTGSRVVNNAERIFIFANGIPCAKVVNTDDISNGIVTAFLS